MSEWRGLHNPKWHHLERSGHVSCDSCGETRCGQADPCRCCLFAEWGQAQSLRAEVKRLTALLKAADDVVASQDRHIGAALDRIQDAINTVLQQAQGVREFGGSLDWARGAESAAEIVQDALRGESDE